MIFKKGLKKITHRRKEKKDKNKIEQRKEKKQGKNTEQQIGNIEIEI